MRNSISKRPPVNFHAFAGERRGIAQLVKARWCLGIASGRYHASRSPYNVFKKRVACR